MTSSRSGWENGDEDGERGRTDTERRRRRTGHAHTHSLDFNEGGAPISSDYINIDRSPFIRKGYICTAKEGKKKKKIDDARLITAYTTYV